MKCLRLLLLNLSLLLMLGCNRKNDTQPDCEIMNSESLLAWTSDTIMATNRPLVLLMDTLYRYVRTSDETTHIEDKLLWMDNYRKQLVDYYDRETLNSDTLSDYERASAVIKMADTLWEVGKEDCTMGKVVDNDVKFTRMTFTHYNEYAKLLDICHTENEKDLLRKEFQTWVNLENLVSDIFYRLVELKFYEGSICGVIKSDGSLKMLEAHISLYQRENKWRSSNNLTYETSGVFADCAKDLLVRCCNQAVRNNFIEDYYIEYDGSQREYYKQLPKVTTELIERLPSVISEWLDARQSWINEVGTDHTTICYQLNSGEVLIRLANVESSI